MFCAPLRRRGTLPQQSEAAVRLPHVPIVERGRRESYGALQKLEGIGAPPLNVVKAPSEPYSSEAV